MYLALCAECTALLPPRLDPADNDLIMCGECAAIQNVNDLECGINGTFGLSHLAHSHQSTGTDAVAFYGF